MTATIGIYPINPLANTTGRDPPRGRYRRTMIYDPLRAWRNKRRHDDASGNR